MSVKALHTAVRRYLLGRLHAFTSAARERAVALQEGRAPAELPVPPGDTTIARDLLRAVEATVPADFRTVEELRAWFLVVGERFQDDRRLPRGTTGTGERIQVRYEERDAEELAAARVERERFCAFVRGLSSEELRHVAPLPYRHLLSERQSTRWRAALAERWNARPRVHSWYPLHGGPAPPDVLALQDLHFYLEVAPEAFHALFWEHGISRVFEFVENHVFERDYEMDVELFEPRPAERFFTSRELDWVVYVSHEHSITFAGDWLLAGVKAIWPNWQERIYTDYGYAVHLGQKLPASSPWFRRAELLPP